MVPGVGFEPTRLAASVFETDMSAVPSPGHAPIAYRQSESALKACVLYHILASVQEIFHVLFLSKAYEARLL